MPIHIDFFHPGRLVIIVARGVVTNDDLASSFRQLIESGALHYRKIIDISSPSNPMSAEDIEGTAARFRSLPNAAARVQSPSWSAPAALPKTRCDSRLSLKVSGR